MSKSGEGLRLAEPEEIRAELVANPSDFWIQSRLDLDEQLVARAARDLWGPPVQNFAGGERLWKLWSEDRSFPAYIAIGLLPPAVLFSNGMLPDAGVRAEIAADLRRMLEAAGGAVPIPPLKSPSATPSE